MEKNINFGGGKVIWNIFDFDKIFQEGKINYDSLTEDLIQVEYFDNIVLDVGFYPEFDPSGIFRILVIRKYDWNNHLILKEIKNINLLKATIEEVVKKIEKDIRRRGSLRVEI